MSDDPTAGLRIRDAVRAVVLDPADRVLLVRFEFPRTGRRWALPGGGVQPGETHESALRRELGEELGMSEVEVGPHIWTRLHIIPFADGRHDGQRESIYLVHTAAFEPQPLLTWSQLNAEYVYELRWWNVADIVDGLPFAPASLGTNLRRLVCEGAPNPPIDVGV